MKFARIKRTLLPYPHDFVEPIPVREKDLCATAARWEIKEWTAVPTEVALEREVYKVTNTIKGNRNISASLDSAFSLRVNYELKRWAVGVGKLLAFDTLENAMRFAHFVPTGRVWRAIGTNVFAIDHLLPSTTIIAASRHNNLNLIRDWWSGWYSFTDTVSLATGQSLLSGSGCRAPIGSVACGMISLQEKVHEAKTVFSRPYLHVTGPIYAPRKGHDEY